MVPGGAAQLAGVENGDLVVAWEDIFHPSATHINRLVRAKSGRNHDITVRSADGSERAIRIQTRKPGSIQARMTLIAENYLLVAGIVPMIGDRPSPAAKAKVPVGAVIVAVDGTTVQGWSDVIDLFVSSAGQTIDLTYDLKGNRKTVAFDVPATIRTVLGLGIGSVIVSVDGRTTVSYGSGSNAKERSVTHPEGTRAILEELSGRTGVPVTFRRHEFAPIENALIDVTPDMIDPWLRRVQYKVNLFPALERILIRETNPLLAVQLGVKKTYYFVHQVYQVIERMLFSRTIGTKNISGPLGIMSIGAKVAKRDFVQLLFFLAMISANLAVINFLPLPIVDGGLMVFLIIEKIKGTPVSLRIQVATQVVGLVMIVTIFVLVTFQDVVKMWG